MSRPSRAAGHTCRRIGCERAKPMGATFCDVCWSRVPGWLKAAIARARQAGDAALLTGLWIKASTLAAATAKPISPARFQARTAAMLGERDAEAAE